MLQIGGNQMGKASTASTPVCSGKRSVKQGLSSCRDWERLLAMVIQGTKRSLASLVAIHARSEPRGGVMRLWNSSLVVGRVYSP
jgi:hypothetical protein